MSARSRPPIRRPVRRPVRRPSRLTPRSRSAFYQQKKQEQDDAAKAEAPVAEQKVAAAQEQIATQGAGSEPFEGLLNQTAPTPTPAPAPTPAYSGGSFGPYPTQPQDTNSPQALPAINRMAGGQDVPRTPAALNRSMASSSGTGNTGAYGTNLTPSDIQELLARAEANAQTAPQKRRVSRRRVNYIPRLKRRSMLSSRLRRF